MKRFACFIILFCTSVYVFAQNTDPRPTKSRFYSSRYKSYLPKAGDILIYNVKKDTGNYTLLVNIQKYNNEISLAYSIKEMIKNGNVIIPEKALNEAYKYDTLITDTLATLKDEIVCWMSKKNYKELYYVKESIMDMGNGKETFGRGNTTILKIKIKGRDNILTVFKMENKGDKSKKYINVLTDMKNPLITKLDTGKLLMVLKEVR